MTLSYRIYDFVIHIITCATLLGVTILSATEESRTLPQRLVFTSAYFLLGVFTARVVLTLLEATYWLWVSRKAKKERNNL